MDNDEVMELIEAKIEEIEMLVLGLRVKAAVKNQFYTRLHNAVEELEDSSVLAPADW